jgi:hypothetical protein
VTGIQRAVLATATASLLWSASASAQVSTARPIPDGMQWTGFTCRSTPGCAWPAGALAWSQAL